MKRQHLNHSKHLLIDRSTHNTFLNIPECIFKLKSSSFPSDGQKGWYLHIQSLKKIFIPNTTQLKVFSFINNILKGWVNVLLSTPEKGKHHSLISKWYGKSAYLHYKSQVTHGQKDYWHTQTNRRDQYAQHRRKPTQQTAEWS